MIGISDLEYLCAEVRQIARKAGAFLRDERQNFDRERVEEKSAHNYVSYVDKESERRLVEQLSTLFPEAGFIAEEGSGSLTDEEYCWDREELLLGVVYEVCRNECFYAWKGSKAYLDGKEIRVTDVAVLDKAFVALGFPYDSDHYRPVAQKLVDRLYGYAGGTRLLGSAAAELCYVACGRFDARIEGHLGPWDVAAGGLILMQAGGRLSDFAGGDTWPSAEQVMASNGVIHDKILRLL